MWRGRPAREMPATQLSSLKSSKHSRHVSGTSKNLDYETDQQKPKRASLARAADGGRPHMHRCPHMCGAMG